MRRDLGAPRGPIGWNVKVDRLVVALPSRDYGYAVTEFDQAFRTVAAIIFGGNTAACKRMAMREDEAHQPTCSTVSDPGGSGRISDCAGTEGSRLRTY